MTKLLRAVAILTLGLLASTGTGWADTLVAVEHEVASGHAPRLGNDGISDYVVYVEIVDDPLGYPNPGDSDVWLQRLANGAPYGAPVQISSGPQYNTLPDASGRFVVYCSFDDAGSQSGRIMVYDTRRGDSFMLGSATVLYEARVHGTKVVWTAGDGVDVEVHLSDVSWYGTGRPAEILARSAVTRSAEIGDRFVVWSEGDIVAFDLASWTGFEVTNGQSANMQPTTSGAWVVWVGGGVGRQVLSRNVDSGEERLIGAPLSHASEPRIHADLVTWDVYGDLFLHRLSTNETFQVTDDHPKSGHDVFTNPAGESWIAYSDNRTTPVDERIYVSQVTFIPTPVANAGPDQTVHVATSATLDGSGSSDPRGLGPLTYAWRVVSQPSGSPSVQLSDPSAVSPTFVPSWEGEYVVELTVTNTAGGRSSDTAVVSTTNSQPLADAGPDRLVTLAGTTVELDGAQSYDPDGDAMTYAWEFLSTPPGSQVALLVPPDDPAHPTFVADLYGTYVAQLVVSDSWSSSNPDTVTVSFENLPPVASAGLSRTVEAFTAVILDGSGSSDANGDPMSFAWTLVASPSGSDAALANPTSVSPSLTPDREGLYVAQLVVSDGTLTSEPSTVQIQAVMTQSAAVETITIVQDGVAALPVGALKNDAMRNALGNKLNAANADIAAGNYAAALQKLEHDILPKTDGCATSSPPSPDANDWIKTCAEQEGFYPLVLDAIAAVLSLM